MFQVFGFRVKELCLLRVPDISIAGISIMILGCSSLSGLGVDGFWV